MKPSRSPFQVVKFKEQDGTPAIDLVGPQGRIQEVADWATMHSLSEDKKLNSVHSMAYDLKHWYTWLHLNGKVWNEVDYKVLPFFAAWLRFGEQLTDRVIPITPTQIREESTIGRILSSVYAFYKFYLTTPMAVSIQKYGAYQQSIAKMSKSLLPVSAHKKPPKKPRSLTRDELNRVIAACDTKRDLLLILLLGERGMRVGGALGLRHEDISSRHATYTIEPRNDNVNGAFAKTKKTWVLPLRKDMVDIHAEYMYYEYGDLDCDYLFVNMHGRTKGQPMTYGGANTIRQKLVKKTGIKFTLHELRHTFATLALSAGVPIAVVQFMLTHMDSSTTTGIYTHLEVETMRAYLDGTQIDEPHAKSFIDSSSIAEIRQQLDGGLKRIQ